MSLDPARCPVCGQDHHCGVSAGKSHCWCFEQEIPPESLALVAEEARGIACLCRTCALGEPDLKHERDGRNDELKRR